MLFKSGGFIVIVQTQTKSMQVFPLVHQLMNDVQVHPTIVDWYKESKHSSSQR